MIAINYARLKCTYCFTIDAITLALIIMAFINPIYALPAAFAFGFSYVGAGYEAVYQADHYNFFSASVLAFIHLVYWAGIAASFVLLFFTGFAEPFAFAFAVILMEVVNRVRYPLESPMIFDMVIIIPYIIGIMVLFYG